MEPVLQSHLPHDPPGARLPGIAPLAMADWLQVDEAFAGQMALRDAWIETRRGLVLAMDESAQAAAAELLDLVLGILAGRADFETGGDAVRRPDGEVVALNRDDPLATLGRLVQEDFCLLEKRGAEHVLSAAVLCFPAGWTLSEKMGRPLGLIHGPVAAYDAGMARRVQRMFDAIRVEQPLWRANALFYDDPGLFAPFTEAEPRPRISARPAYLRSERQSLLRLPETGAVVFSIHTYVVRREDLTAEQRALLGQGL